MQHHRVAAFTLLLALSIARPSPAAPASVISEVTVSPAFFNPTVGQRATVSFRAGTAGTARVTILDRDRFVIRSLAPVEVGRGPASVSWDGRDGRGSLVPDEAWNVRIELAGETYDPSRGFAPVMEEVQRITYSDVSGVISYRLGRTSRVHIEAGQAKAGPAGPSTEGPILRTVVDREPRVAGAVVEPWNGFDASGTIAVSALPDFVVGVLATSLPESTIITRGNYKQSFLEYASRNRPASALVAKARTTPTHHHAGLDAFEDSSPGLEVKRMWTAAGALDLEVRVTGVSAGHFLRQPGSLTVYVDEERVLLRETPSSPSMLRIPAARLSRGKRVVVNWDSEYGPGATTAFLIGAPAKRASHAGVGR